MFLKNTLLQYALFALVILLLTGCAKSDVSNQDSEPAGQESSPTEVIVIDDGKEKGAQAEEMTPSEKDNSAADDIDIIQEEGSLEEKPAGDNLALNLVLRVKEISIDDFLKEYGEDFVSTDPVLLKAERIAEIELNSKVFDSDYLSGIKTINLKLFDNSSYQVLVDMLSIDGKTISLKGSSEVSATAVFFLSATEEQVLATLRLPESNYLYTIKYLYPSGKHYLFKGLITEVEQYQCEALTPPGQD